VKYADEVVYTSPLKYPAASEQELVPQDPIGQEA
jgi:hypothetical protein